MYRASTEPLKTAGGVKRDDKKDEKVSAPRLEAIPASFPVKRQ
jgi:hypothetical protein